MLSSNLGLTYIGLSLNALHNNLLTFLRNEKRQESMKKINCYYSRRSKFSKDHRNKTEVPDPLVVENLISFKLNDIRKLARLITQ